MMKCMLYIISTFTLIEMCFFCFSKCFSYNRMNDDFGDAGDPYDTIRDTNGSKEGAVHPASFDAMGIAISMGQWLAIVQGLPAGLPDSRKRSPAGYAYGNIEKNNYNNVLEKPKQSGSGICPPGENSTGSSSDKSKTKGKEMLQDTVSNDKIKKLLQKVEKFDKYRKRYLANHPYTYI